VVVFTYTVIDPLAMMVESVDTLVAYVAMSRISGVNGFAIRTQTLCFILLHKLVKV
jgi:hypothetical protein